MYSLQDDWNCMYSNWSFFYSHHHFSESVKHWSEEPEATSAYIVWCVASFLKLLHQSFLFVDLLHAVSAISESNFFDLNFLIFWFVYLLLLHFDSINRRSYYRFCENSFQTVLNLQVPQCSIRWKIPLSTNDHSGQIKYFWFRVIIFLRRSCTWHDDLIL